MKALFPIVLFALLLSACSSGLMITSDSKEGTDFSKYQTYEIISPENLNPYTNPVHKVQIEKSIREEMGKLEFKESTDKPSISVNYFVIVNSVRDVNTYVNYYGRRWSIATVNTNVIEYKEGTLIIDLVDTNKKEIVWHGVASGTVNNNLKDTETKINEAVAGVFRKYTDMQSQASSL